MRKKHWAYLKNTGYPHTGARTKESKFAHGTNPSSTASKLYQFARSTRATKLGTQKHTWERARRRRRRERDADEPEREKERERTCCQREHRQLIRGLGVLGSERARPAGRVKRLGACTTPLVAPAAAARCQLQTTPRLKTGSARPLVPQKRPFLRQPVPVSLPCHSRPAPFWITTTSGGCAPTTLPRQTASRRHLCACSACLSSLEIGSWCSHALFYRAVPQLGRFDKCYI